MKVIEIIEGSQPQSDDDKAKRLKNALARAKKYKTTQGSMMGKFFGPPDEDAHTTAIYKRQLPGVTKTPVIKKQDDLVPRGRHI